MGPINFISDDIARHVKSFCDPYRYLSLGLVNRQFNETYKKEERRTSTLGYIESDTSMDLDKVTGGEIIVTLARSKHLHHLIPREIERGIEWDHFCVETEAERGNKEFFIWLSTSDLFWLPENAYAAAAYTCNTEMMTFLLKSGFGYPDARCRTVAKKNRDVSLMKWIEETEKMDGYVLSEAVKNDDLKTVIEKYRSDTHYDWILHDAVVSGSASVVEFLIESGVEPTTRELNTSNMYDWEEVAEVLKSFEYD